MGNAFYFACMQTEVTAVLAGNFFSSVKQQEMLLRVLFNIIMGYYLLHIILIYLIIVLIIIINY